MRTHLTLMGKQVIAVSGAGGVLGVYGAYQAVQDADTSTGWAFIASCFAILFFAQIGVVQQAIARTRSAAGNVSQTMFAIEQNANVANWRVENASMTIGDEVPTRRTPRRRWFSRVLSDADRDDLSERCIAAASAAAEFIHRNEPYWPRFPPTQEERDVEDREREEHKAETKRTIQAMHAPRLRDLLNEAAEAGYSLPSDLEQFRITGEIDWHSRDGIISGVGVVGRRVKRGAKRL